MQTSSNKREKKSIRNFLDFLGLWPKEPPDQNPYREPVIDLTADKQTWELFQYFRGEIKHEHALLAGRVTWYITCQSFFVNCICY